VQGVRWKKNLHDKNHADNCAMQLNEENRLYYAAISSNNTDTLSILAAF
jgi:hypothetical protein